MMPPERTRALFDLIARDADIALIEGVMGLFDGFGYYDEAGSTAQVAKLLGAPVLVVLDASQAGPQHAPRWPVDSATSIADVAVAGFLVNRAARRTHGAGIAQAITEATGLPVLGWLPRDTKLEIPERHLGLIPSVEPGNCACGSKMRNALSRRISTSSS